MNTRVAKFCLLIVVLLSACAPTRAPSTGGLRVVAAESFLRDIAQNVAGDRLTVETLIPVGADPHEYQLTPRDTAAITSSQVFIVNGLGYEGWLKETLDNVGGERVVIIATEGLSPNPDPTGEHLDGDPHMWMNPMNVLRYVENIRDGLSRADPDGSEIYAANADAYITGLKELDQWIKDEVAGLPAAKRLLVTNHDALGYFSEAYGFKVIGAVIPGVTNEASPSAQAMASLIETIKSSGAPAIFLDISENQDLARQIASESGAKVVTGLYVETLSAADGPAPTYIEMIKYDVSTIVEALRQAP
jgi:ABC-type Zn uptake system ZnuABC Zn-binding protein ZnuA